MKKESPKHLHTLAVLREGYCLVELGVPLDDTQRDALAKMTPAQLALLIKARKAAFNDGVHTAAKRANAGLQPHEDCC